MRHLQSYSKTFSLDHSDLKSLAHWASAVADRLDRRGVELSQGATDSELAAAEASLDFRFDDDFRALYTVFNGFYNNDWTPELVNLWPLQRITSSATDSFIPFADHSVGIFFYGFVPNHAGVFRSVGYSYSSPERIASSFTEAIAMLDSGNGLLA